MPNTAVTTTTVTAETLKKAIKKALKGNVHRKAFLEAEKALHYAQSHEREKATEKFNEYLHAVEQWNEENVAPLIKKLAELEGEEEKALTA